MIRGALGGLPAFQSSSAHSGMLELTDLLAWREASAVADKVKDVMPLLTGQNAGWVRNQMIKASESVPANIAEGYGRGISKDCLRFFRQARASSLELESHLRRAGASGRLPPDVVADLIGHNRRARYLLARYMDWMEKKLNLAERK